MRDNNIFWRFYQITVILFAFFLLYSTAPLLAEDMLGYGYRQWEAFVLLSFFILLSELTYIPGREGDFLTASFPFTLVLLICLGFPPAVWLFWLLAFLTSLLSRREDLFPSLITSSLKAVSLYFPALLYKKFGGDIEDVYMRVLYTLLCGVAYYISDRVVVGIEVALREGRFFKKNFWKSRWEESYLRYLIFLLGGMLVSAGYNTPFQLPLFLLMGFFLWLAIYFIRSTELNRLNTRGVFEAFSEIAEGRWMGMQGHGKRVGMLVDEITKILDLPYDERERLILASILHDIGVVDTPYELLNYPTPEGEDSDEFKHHVIRSAEIVSAFPTLKETADFIRYHHERPDGSGYPEGRKGDKIPFWAYVIGACCDFDDSTCYKSWRERNAPAETLRRMEEAKGKLYEERAISLLKEAARKLGRVR